MKHVSPYLRAAFRASISGEMTWADLRCWVDSMCGAGSGRISTYSMIRLWIKRGALIERINADNTHMLRLSDEAAASIKAREAKP